jgi:hypothetical protein
MLEVTKWAIAFGLGLLFRKRVGRAIVRLWKWLSNAVVTAQIVSVRTYIPVETPVQIQDFTREVYDDVKTRILNLQLYDVFGDGMRVAMPTFGMLKLSLSRIGEQENPQDEEETLETIKMTLKPESPVRFGIREVQLLNDFSKTAEVLFNAAERLIVTGKRIGQDYTLLEFSRLGRFVEEKTFEMKDEDLGTHVLATANRLTLTVSPTSEIAKATKKYLLV